MSNSLSSDDPKWSSCAKAVKLTVHELHDIAAKLEQYGLMTSHQTISDTSNHLGSTDLLSIICKDELTGLCNKRFFKVKTERHMQDCRDNGRTFALFFIDIDGFKSVNDIHGHAAGDKILRNIADNLTACVRHGDEVARIHGDEFLIMFDDITNIDGVITLANKILKAIKKITYNGIKLDIGASIGITLFPSPGITSLEDMVEMADHAMYQSKKRGKNCFTIYSKQSTQSK